MGMNSYSCNSTRRRGACKALLSLTSGAVRGRARVRLLRARRDIILSFKSQSPVAPKWRGSVHCACVVLPHVPLVQYSTYSQPSSDDTHDRLVVYREQEMACMMICSLRGWDNTATTVTMLFPNLPQNHYMYVQRQWTLVHQHYCLDNSHLQSISHPPHHSWTDSGSWACITDSTPLVLWVHEPHPSQPLFWSSQPVYWREESGKDVCSSMHVQ